MDEKGIDLFISLNPDYFDVYEQAGDYYMFKKQYNRAISFYKKSLAFVIPGEKEINRIKEKYADCEKKTAKSGK